MKIILSALLFSFTAHAHNNSDLRAFHLIHPTTKTMDAVADEFEVVRKLADGFEVYVPVEKLNRFKALAPKAKLVPVNKEKIDDAGYRDFEMVKAELKKLETDYPQLAKLETYGTTQSGHPLLVLKVSDNVTVDENEPELMITSATHGDEIITVEVEMELINVLLQNYGKDERLTKMISERELFFIPVVNPQGFTRRDRYANKVDPNRDYPFPENENKQSVDCIDSLRKWFHSRDIKGSLDLHAYGKLVMFPWGYTKTSPAREDETSFQYLANAMAETNKYEAGQISKIIYVAKGSSADYYYWKHKTVAMAVELTTSKAPLYMFVPRIVEESKEMVWRFIENF